jgi:cobalamin biosynthesis protein CobW
MIDLSQGQDRPSVGVLLVGGFLGAGKTTLLRRLVRDPNVGPKLAVLVNELGALGLDGELIRVESESDALRTVQLDSGCLCCTLKGEMGQALEELARPKVGAPPAQIVVELSGAALASEVHFQISTQALSASYHADGLVCVVDARQAPRWSAEAKDLFDDQLARADLVLLSKVDLASPAERQRTEALVAAIAPGARVVPCVQGDIDPGLLLGLDNPRAPDSPRAAHSHALRGETVALPQAVSGPALESFLDEVATAFFRIKGWVDVQDRPCLVQCVGDQIEIVPQRNAGGVRRLTFIAPFDSPAWALLPPDLNERLRAS